MASRAQKILVCGDVSGEFNQLFKRVLTVNKKAGPFDMLLCVGDFFGDGDNSQWLPYKNGTLRVPLPTYVLGPSKAGLEKHYADLRGCELAENVIYLGPSGIYPCSSGLRIAYLSGFKTTPTKLAGYTNLKVGELESEARQHTTAVDILLTSQLPSFVDTFAAKPAGCDVSASGCGLVARLAHSLKPRYHFAAGLNVHYERLPYRNHQVLQESPRHVSRFLSLAAVGNSSKSKWLYAFTITPAEHCSKQDLTAQPPDVTECPYSTALLPPLQQEGAGEINTFFYGGGSHPQQRGSKREGNDLEEEGARKKRLPPQPTGPCWFCLSSPEVEKHLVVSVGEHIYLALAKGGLVPQHLMLLPIHHYQTSLDLEKDALEELSRFKHSLSKMFSVLDQSLVFFERNYRTSHLQLHVVPVPDTLAHSVGDAFVSQGSDCGLTMDEVPRRTELSAAVQPGQPFLFVEPPHGPCLLHRVRKGYNMRFDREVLASEELLNLPDRVDWKNCQGSREEETIAREKIRTMFKPFDFTIDDGSDSDSSDDE